ncbi:hypothetical protein LZK98_13495 [Sphingomonas cannabina]|uniref:YncE family protein n=1 Tax=Sphingomonas cannabina TaxID=2899123 RepID=UPI001F45F7D6|nr:hypothetical protein [Sphingomonas cannabina]UIJ44088.1 hypothetical protein LZK98_13495 [Sphingomonas cannabina]
MTMRLRWLLTGLLCTPLPAQAQLVAVGLDADARMVDGEVVPPPAPPPDRVVFLEFRDGRALNRREVEVPISFQGPPSAIAFTQDRRTAFVTAATGRTPAEPDKIGPADLLIVVDLAGNQPRVVQTLHLGASPASLALSPNGSMLVVPHADDDSATILRVTGGRAAIVERVRFAKGARPLSAAFVPAGDRVLMTFAGQNVTRLFAVEAGRLKPEPLTELSAGVYPAALAVCGTSGLAVVANYGVVSGDADTVSLIDLTGDRPRVIDTATVGPAPEGVACSPDGRRVAAAIQNMSTVPSSNPRYAPVSKVFLLSIENRRLIRRAEADIGAWSQGVAFVENGTTLVAESIGDQSLHVFRIVNHQLEAAGPPIRFESGGPASLGVSPE